MEDPEDDWDVEAELQRQLDALDLSEEEEEEPSSLRAPKRSPRTGQSTKKTAQSGQLDLTEKQPLGGQNTEEPWVHLEGLLREREEKLNDFDSSLRALLGMKPPAEAAERVSVDRHVLAGTSQGNETEDEGQCGVEIRESHAQTANGAMKVEDNYVFLSTLDSGTASLSSSRKSVQNNAASIAHLEPPLASGTPIECASLDCPVKMASHVSLSSGQLHISVEEAPENVGMANDIQRERARTIAVLEEGSRLEPKPDACTEGASKDLRSEILALEYQVHLDALQQRHETTTSEIERAQKEETARQAEEEARAQARRAASEAASKKREGERRRAQEERESRMKAIRAQLELAARQAFAASRIGRAYRRHVQNVRQKAAVRMQAGVRGFLCRKEYERLCTVHLKALIKRCEAQHDIKGLEAAALRARSRGLEEEARAAAERTRARVVEARAAIGAAAEEGSLEELDRAREWASSAGVDHSEIASAEAVFARRVESQLACIESGVSQGLPLVNLLNLMKEAQLLGVNRGRLDQLERDVRARDRSAVQELQEAAQSGSFKGSGGYEEAVRKAGQFGLLEEIGEADETVNLRRESLLEGLTRVLEIGLGGQSDLTRLVNEAVRLNMEDVARAAEARWEDQVRERVSELTEAARSGSRARLAGLVRALGNRGRTDGIETAKSLLEKRIVGTREALARAAKQGSKEEIEKCVKQAKELGLFGQIKDARIEHAQRIRLVLESFEAAVKERALDTSTEGTGELAAELETVSGAALALGVSKNSLEELKAAVRDRLEVNRCRQSGGFGRIHTRDYLGQPARCSAQNSRHDDVTSTSEKRFDDVIVDALKLGSCGQHQFLANAVKHPLRKSEREVDRREAEWGKISDGVVPDRMSKGTAAMHETRGVPLWPYRIDWGEIERLRLCWQHSVAVDLADTSHKDKADAERCDAQSEGSSEEEPAHGGLRSRKSQVALESESSESEKERLLSHQGASASEEKGPSLSRSFLEKAAGGLGVLGGSESMDLALEGLRGLGPKGLLSKLCPKLRFVRLDVNQLTTLESGFDGLETALETLSVRDNYLSSLRGLEGLRGLQVLRLDANLIKRVDLKSETKGFLWPSLTELGLSANRITRLRGLGEVCANLEILEVAGNAVQRFEGVLRGLTRLRVLDVARNRLKARSLWPELRQCPLLTTLVTSSNKLCELPSRHVLSGHVLLRELWLNGNGIRKLEAVCWLPNLQRLYLQDNAIETVAPLWGCPNLEVLDLSFNCISDPRDFQHLGCLRSLRSLQLNDNPVASTGHSYATAVLSAVPWLRELDNEAVTDVVRERVLKNLVEMKAGVLVGVVNKLRVTERVNERRNAGRVVSVVPMELNPSVLEEDSEGLDLLGEPTPQSAGERVSALWETVLRAVESGESNGLLPVQEPSVRDAGIRHQRFCAEWRARLSRSAREQAGSSASGGEKYCANSDPRNGKVPSLLMQGLGQCFQEYVRFDSTSAVQSGSEGSDAKLLRNEGYYAEEQQKRVQMIARVQAIWRTRQVRKRFVALVKERAEIRRTTEQTAAARIQALWRGHVARRERGHVAEREAAARKVQARWRGHFLRRRIERAMAAAKYVDEDDFEFEDEGLLAGLGNGLSRPGTVKKDNWVGDLRPEVELKEVKRSVELERRDLPAEPTTKTSVNRNERKPLEPLHNPASSGSVNAPPSSVVPLPTISPPRSTSHVENRREGHVLLPEIRLASSQADPTLRTSKRFSEPIGGTSLDGFLGRSSSEVTPRQLGDEASTQSTPRGPHVPRSMRKKEKQRQSISEIAQEWGFKDEGTAAAALRSREKLMRHKNLETQQKSLQDPEKRLQLFKAHAKRAPKLIPRPSLARVRPAWAGVSGTDEGSSSDG